MDPQRESMLERWEAVRNAILRSEQGELQVTYMRESDFLSVSPGEGGEAAAAADVERKRVRDNIVGIYVDLVLKFPGAIKKDFTLEEVEEFEKGFEQGIKDSQEKQDTE